MMPVSKHEFTQNCQDLDFTSVIVQKLSMILIASPELAEFPRRLKSLESRVSLMCPHIHNHLCFIHIHSKTAKRYS
jgi:Vacuolar protein 14 C-terminal Fig4p binding